MRKLIMQMNISIDGFADHTVAIADDELHEFASEMLDKLDIALFGRVTYQLMESYWPQAERDPNESKSVIAFARKFNAMPKIVFSKTLQNAGWNNTQLIKEDLVKEVIRLKQQPGKILSIGGLKVCRELIRHGLIDEYWLLVHPVIVGKGRRLFEGLEKAIDLKIVGVRAFKSSAVVLHYEKR
jgi:dihydrofolate reductase